MNLKKMLSAALVCGFVSSPSWASENEITANTHATPEEATPEETQWVESTRAESSACAFAQGGYKVRTKFCWDSGRTTGNGRNVTVHYNKVIECNGNAMTYVVDLNGYVASHALDIGRCTGQ